MRLPDLDTNTIYKVIFLRNLLPQVMTATRVGDEKVITCSLACAYGDDIFSGI